MPFTSPENNLAREIQIHPNYREKPREIHPNYRYPPSITEHFAIAPCIGTTCSAVSSYDHACMLLSSIEWRLVIAHFQGCHSSAPALDTIGDPLCNWGSRASFLPSPFGEAGWVLQFTTCPYVIAGRCRKLLLTRKPAKSFLFDPRLDSLRTSHTIWCHPELSTRGTGPVFQHCTCRVYRRGAVSLLRIRGPLR